MAQRPDGKSAATERVVFTRPAAERIANVVRRVEGGNRDQAPLVFGRAIDGVGASTDLVFRVATVTGQWAVGVTATVTFSNVTSTPNTVVATNLHLPIDVASGQSADCTIARAGGAWYLTSVNFTKLKAFSAGEVQVFGHNTSGYAQWYSVTTCSTSTAA